MAVKLPPPEMKARPKSAHGSFDAVRFLAGVRQARIAHKYEDKTVIYSQGNPCDDVFFLEAGRVKLSVVSKQGKEAVLAVVGRGDFFGEGCLNHQTVRMATATAVGPVVAFRLDKKTLAGLLRRHPDFSDFFINYLLARTLRVEEDLVDHIFNSSEKRLARMLLLLAHFAKDAKTEIIIPRVSQETLAAMVGTTRPRINFFMNKFRKLGFVKYAKDGGKIEVHSSLLGVVLSE